MASKRGLQNPDLLVIGAQDDHRVIRAADAKFSIETARAKQVSADVVRRQSDGRWLVLIDDPWGGA